jgi:SAM-dependent methyltransferase
VTIDEVPIGEYWRHRPLKAPPDYEDGYWGTVVDPDGVVRVRSEERHKHLEDVKAELDFINALPGGRLLDVGCGLGFFLSGVDRKWERHGVEVSALAAETARNHGTIHVGQLAEMAFPDGYFDAVVCHHVIEHVPDPAPFLREIHRILRPNGALVLGTPDFDSGCARRFGDRYRLLHDPTHVSLFTSDSMRRFLRDSGFRVDKVDFPFFDSRYFTEENLLRLFDTTRISPPFYGNFMTFYCRRLPDITLPLAETAAALSVASHAAGSDLAEASELLRRVRADEATTMIVAASGEGEPAAELLSRSLGHTLCTPASVRERLAPGNLVIVVGSPGAPVVSAVKACGAKAIVLRVLASDPVEAADVIIDAGGTNAGSRRAILFALAGAIADSVTIAE